jgi:hypothetical protein
MPRLFARCGLADSLFEHPAAIGTSVSFCKIPRVFYVYTEIFLRLLDGVENEEPQGMARGARGLRPDRRTHGLRNLDAFRQQPVTIFTNPPETAIVIDDYLHLTAPGIVTLSRKGDHLVKANKNGYESASLKIDRTWSWWVVGDIFGCFIIFSPLCIAHDIDQGGYYVFDDKIYVTLNPSPISEPAVPK